MLIDNFPSYFGTFESQKVHVILLLPPPPKKGIKNQTETKIDWRIIQCLKVFKNPIFKLFFIKTHPNGFYWTLTPVISIRISSMQSDDHNRN